MIRELTNWESVRGENGTARNIKIEDNFGQVASYSFLSFSLLPRFSYVFVLVARVIPSLKSSSSSQWDLSERKEYQKQRPEGCSAATEVLAACAILFFWERINLSLSLPPSFFSHLPLYFSFPKSTPEHGIVFCFFSNKSRIRYTLYFRSIRLSFLAPLARSLLIRAPANVTFARPSFSPFPALLFFLFFFLSSSSSSSMAFTFHAWERTIRITVFGGCFIYRCASFSRQQSLPLRALKWRPITRLEKLYRKNSRAKPRRRRDYM